MCVRWDFTTIWQADKVDRNI
jgi:hypothetical protein